MRARSSIDRSEVFRGFLECSLVVCEVAPLGAGYLDLLQSNQSYCAVGHQTKP